MITIPNTQIRLDTTEQRSELLSLHVLQVVMLFIIVVDAEKITIPNTQIRLDMTEQRSELLSRRVHQADIPFITVIVAMRIITMIILMNWDIILLMMFVQDAELP